MGPELVGRGGGVRAVGARWRGGSGTGRRAPYALGSAAVLGAGDLDPVAGGGSGQRSGTVAAFGSGVRVRRKGNAGDD